MPRVVDERGFNGRVTDFLSILLRCPAGDENGIKKTKAPAKAGAGN